MFPRNVWMTGSGTQFNMNGERSDLTQMLSTRDTPLGSTRAGSPNDHSTCRSSNDSFVGDVYRRRGEGRSVWCQR